MQSSKITDQNLVTQYIQGNEACLEMLINRHKDRIFTTIILIVKDSYIAEDLFQETFIKIIKNLKKGKYNEEGKFLPWAIRIARNMAIDYFRKMKRMPIVTGSDGEDVFRKIKLAVDNREEQMIRHEKESMVRAVINKLPEEQRQVLILRHYGDLSFKEIAAMTGVSINTALGRMRYALNNMRKMMEHTSLNTA
ncbi:MAG: RNA polymerase sigma factor [Bacteroidia bacterium]|jgi:RNA polymerase sigma factor (sigma-70 family)|nr:sigma-70 family RNA polymerase sigma factor [Bacteroidia bacterium]|tara:strand:+ start:3076 stop:3657 length:582 start_codon:yes stop_codon:yes gene_type:complete